MLKTLCNNNIIIYTIIIVIYIQLYTVISKVYCRPKFICLCSCKYLFKDLRMLCALEALSVFMGI